MLQIVGSLTIVIDETYLTQNTKIKCPWATGEEKKVEKTLKK